jgi:hypothetical protein
MSLPAHASLPCPILPLCRNQELCRDFNDNDLEMCRIYVVQGGDTLSDIAAKFLVSRAAVPGAF